MQIFTETPAAPAPAYPLCPVAALRQAILAGDAAEAARTAALLAGAVAAEGSGTGRLA